MSLTSAGTLSSSGSSRSLPAYSLTQPSLTERLMTSGALPAANALFRSSLNVAWWSSQLTLTPGYVASKRAIVSLIHGSNVGDR